VVFYCAYSDILIRRINIKDNTTGQLFILNIMDGQNNCMEEIGVCDKTMDPKS